MGIRSSEWFSTYSIVARDAETGQLGVAVQTHQMSVGAHVPWLLPGGGAIATQAMVNVSFGPMGLALLSEGVPAPKVVEALVAADARPHIRQVAAVDAHGQAGAWTGQACIPEAGHWIGEGYSVQANMMDRPTVVAAMATAYEGAQGDLAARMLAALRAAQGEGGDIRGMQSAALRVVSGTVDPKALSEERSIYDLRVDEHAQPLDELARLVRLRHAQLLDDEGHRALDRGDRSLAFERWEQARALAPELEEVGFWQAVALADRPAEVTRAAEILSQALAQEARREQWIDLLRRLQVCGLIERSGAAEELIENFPEA